MLDFTSALYLGFRHSAAALRPWPQLTTGKPSVLTEPAAAHRIGAGLASLQGCEQALLAPSTLHLFWDLFAMLAGQPVSIFLDAGAYPIVTWGVERAAGQGIPVRRFPHQDKDAMKRMIERESAARRPVIVSDGLCSSCGCGAPLASYLAVARKRRGLIILDDTQALGLLGHRANGKALYGRGGGGSLRHLDLPNSQVILVSSLAKSFGAPLAALSGSREWVRRFRSRSKTRIYCSPPSAAALRSAERALVQNAIQGDRRRETLARSVRMFRRLLAEVGVAVTGGIFPVQTLRLPAAVDPVRLNKALFAKGIRTVLRQNCGNHLSLSFVLTARHRPEQITRAVDVLASLLAA